MIDDMHFPTLMKILYKCGINKEYKKKTLSAEQLEVVEELAMLVQFKLEDQLATTNASAHSAAIQKYLAKHFIDWSDTMNAAQEQVVINIDTTNNGKNKLNADS